MTAVDTYQRDINRLLRNAVGFDSMLDRMFDVAGTKDVTFPPYNIVRLADEKYAIEMALAGFKESDLDIELKDEVLTIRTKISDDVDNPVGSSVESYENRGYLHRGIARRNFVRKFSLAGDMVVDSASLKDGILEVYMHRVVPEEKRPRKIPISRNLELEHNVEQPKELLQE